MKRFLWLTCLCSASVFALAACGDDDSGGGSDEDGGVSFTDLNEVNDRLDGVDDAVNEVATDLDDLSGNVDDLAGEVDGIGTDVDDLDSRIADLENPEIVSCSVEEQCIPDGIDLVGAGVEELVATLCALEIDCCSPDELIYKFGPGITTVAECTETFVDLINNGFSPDFLEESGYVISAVIAMAQALNDTRVRVEINTAAVDACLEWLDARECNMYVTPEAVEPEHCAGYEAAEYPCDPWLMLTGLQEEGELCGLTEFDECGENLACRYGIGPNGEGICATLAEAGDRCAGDDQCDAHETELFCNRTTGECQERGDEGDDCGYVDPSFTATGYDLGLYFDEGGLQNPGALALECKRGLVCDPVAHECVPICSNGSLCRVGSLNYDCPADHVCNITETPALYNNPNHQWGVCRAPIADEMPCRVPTECASGRCEAFVCAPALKAEGEACTVTTPGEGQADITCATRYCAADSTTTTAGKCATRCSEQSDCADTHFCDWDVIVDEVAVMPYPCDLKRANGNDCNAYYDETVDQGAGDNHQCASGFCDTTQVGSPRPDVCAPKAAASGACASTQHSQCPSTQFCLAAVCTNFVATDGDCAVGGDYSCGAGSYCWYDSVNTVYDCRPYGNAGETCAAGRQCDWYADGLVCATVGAMQLCHAPGEFPTGATCSGGWTDLEGVFRSGDTLCADSWCRGSDSTCAVPIASGEDCNTTNLALNRCADGTYCKYPLDMPGVTAGECSARGLVGQGCDPRYGSQDCLNSAACLLRNDAFVCNTNAVPLETLFCDGG